MSKHEFPSFQSNNKSDHGLFVNNLDLSEPARFKVALHLVKKGVTVTIPPMTKAKSYEDRMNHVDEGDLYINPPMLIGDRMEVKQLTTQFTCERDWPYPKFFVCAKHSFDNADPIPHAYILLAKDEKNMAVVHSSTHPSWTSMMVKDGRYKNMIQDTYVCPTNLIKWRKICLDG